MEISRFLSFFKMAAAARRHLGFSKIQNFNGWSTARGRYASPCQISSKSVERSQRYGDLSVFFQNGGRPPSWICWASVGTTHDDHLMVCIVVPNLVKIDAVVTITWNFQYFARLAWKRLFHAPKIGVLGVFHAQNEGQYQQNPHIPAQVRVVWAIKCENPSTGLTCRWLHEKRYK